MELMLKQENKRNDLIDFLRSLAIVAMVLFHIFYDLNEVFNLYSVNTFLYETLRKSALLFILISGYCIGLSRNNLKRGFKLVTLAMSLTLVTYLMNKDFYIKFGILHFLGIAIIFDCFFRRYNIITLIIILYLWIFIPKNSVDLFILGFNKAPFYSMDYYPLVPFQALFIVGSLLSRFRFHFKFKNKALKAFCRIGKNSLLIYLIHQPIIMGLIYLYVYVFLRVRSL